MAKRRNLKKFIKYTSGSVTGFILWEIGRADEEKHPAYSQLLASLIDLHKDIVCRISHTETGNVKGFYKKLKEDYANGIDSIFNKIDELADQKQA